MNTGIKKIEENEKNAFHVFQCKVYKKKKLINALL